jgi:YebC/PmpR family DNA-binding regulatory protein
MGGHSHWAGIKHKKALSDQKKGKVYTKLIREISIAAREGGGDVNGNPRLRKAMEDARTANMPKDNVENAILRGLGKLPGAVIEEVVFEGYGPDGVAVIVEATTDNRNRATAEIRRIFSAHGGNLGSAGCVAWIFNQKGYLEVERGKVGEDRLLEVVLEAGAEDVKTEEADIYKVLCKPADLEKVKQALAAAQIPVALAEVSMLPSTEVKVGGESAGKLIALMEELEEHDDVKNVYANHNIPDEILAKHQ